MHEKNLQQHWFALRPFLAIRNEEQYEQAVEHLNDLIDEIGTDEAHPLYELLDTLGTLIHAYEERHHAIPDCSGREMLGFFMEKHGLAQASFPEIGSQGVVPTSELKHCSAFRLRAQPVFFTHVLEITF